MKPGKLLADAGIAGFDSGGVLFGSLMLLGRQDFPISRVRIGRKRVRMSQARCSISLRRVWAERHAAMSGNSYGRTPGIATAACPHTIRSSSDPPNHIANNGVAPISATPGITKERIKSRLITRLKH